MPPSIATRRPTGWTLAISDALTVGDLLRLAPSTLSVLAERGLEPDLRDEAEEPTLADVARRHHVALDTLLDELRDAAAQDAAHAAGYERLG